MLNQPAALDRLDHVISRARALGADAADAVYYGDVSASVGVRLGEVEDIGRSETEEIGIRVFVGDQSASVSASDLSIAALGMAVERALAMAREAPADRFAGLAPEDRLADGHFANLDIDDGGDVAMETLRAQALACEDAARAVAGITNSQGASATAARSTYALATSHGFAGAYSGSSHSLSAVVIAGSGEAMQRDYAHHAARHAAALEAPATVGARAGERAVARLNPVKLATGTLPVLFDPRVGASLLGHLSNAINGAAIARRTSFLIDALESRVFAGNISVIDDPLRPRGLRSRPFDGEGLAAQPTEIVRDGVLATWLLDSASARQLGLPPTGHAQRGTSGPPGAGTSNLHMAAGCITREAMIAGISRGVLVTELIGQGVNGLTGDYSRGASGFLIEQGTIVGPVAEITIAGNLKDMFAIAVPASDLEFRYASNTPTVLIEGMTIAGA
jgi:PmbA protein